MLNLKAFKTAQDKVFKAEFHPTQPWVVCATKSDHICVWDWTNQQVLHEVQLGSSGDEELYGDADLARLHTKDPAVVVNPSFPQPAPTRSATTGKVKDVRFLDADVAAAQIAAGHALAHGSSVPAPSSLPVATAMGSQRLVVIVAESKVVVWDLVSHGVKEVPKAALDGKAPTCCAFLFLGGQASPGSRSAGAYVMASPVLAVGCSDGIIRLVHAATLRPMARLVSTHKSSIVALTVCGVPGGYCEEVLGCYASGKVVAWQPFAKPLGVGTALDLSPRAEQKVFDKEPVGVVVVGASEGAGQPIKTLVMTAGPDGRLLGLEPQTLKEVLKVKLQGMPCSLAYAPRGFVSSGTHCVLMGTDLGLVLSVQPTTGSIRVVCNLNALIPSGGKKSPKVYGIAVHPLQPHLVLAATNTGTALLQLASQPPLPAASLPLTSPTQVLSAGGSGVTYIAAVGDLVECITATTVKPPPPPEPAPDKDKDKKDKDKKDKDKDKDKDKKDKKDKKDSGKESGKADKDSKDSKDKKDGGGAQQQQQQLAQISIPVPGSGPSASSATAPATTTNLLDMLDALDALHDETTTTPRQTPTATANGGQNVPTSNLPRAPPVYVAGSSVLGKAKPAVRAVVSASHDGSYVSVCWPAAKQYAIYHQSAATWDEVSNGTGSSVAWHACAPRFAVVEEHAPAIAPVVPPTGKGGKPKKLSKQEQERIKMAEAAAAAAAMMPPTVQVRTCSGRAVNLATRTIPLSPSDAAAAVSGGPLLAVTLRRQLNNAGGLVAGVAAPAALQLYDWDSAKRIGVELAEPLLLAWDPTLTLVALVYSSQVLICAAQPSLQPVASLPISGVTGVEWGMRQLYCMTPTDIYVGFVTLPSLQTYAPPISVHLLKFASLGAVPVSIHNPAALSGGLPPVLQRPAGPLCLLGPRDGYLWMLNAHAQPLALPLQHHAGLKAMCLAAAGNATGALELANKELFLAHHDALASLMCAADGTKGAQAALELKGLSLQQEAQLRIMLKHWPQALQVVEALLAGYVRRPAPGAFKYPVTAAVFGTTSLADDDDDDEADNALDFAALASFAPASVRAYPDDLDWAAPMRQAAPGATPGAHPTAAASAAAGITAPPASAHAPPAAVELALALVTSFLSIGMQDAARHLVQLLIQFVPRLSQQHLAGLVAAMADLGMRSEMPLVADSVAPGAEGGLKEGMSMMAAFLSTNAALVQERLTAAHAPVLAAAQAQSNELAAAPQATTAWKEAMQGIMTGMAPAGTKLEALPAFQVEAVGA